MRRAAARASKLLRTTPAELWTRGRQQLSARLERVSSSPAVRETSDAVFARELAAGMHAEAGALREALAEHTRPRFFASLDDRAGVAALVRTRFADSAGKLLERADRAVVDRFDVLGHDGLSYGAPIDWHMDPLADRHAPLVHWSRVPYLDASIVGDHKVIWELNRHQHLVTLAQAYWLTGDERYAETACRHLMEWMDANPPKRGINWASSLEVAFRAISWCWVGHMLRESRALTAPLWMRMLKYLNVHAHHVASHLSTYFSPNTHLTGEALGLLYIGTLFPELRGAGQWRDLGWSILEQQLPLHIRADGVYFEQTTWYQRYTVDFYLHALLLRERNGMPVARATRDRLELALEPLIHFMRPDGTTPLIGDDDGGRLPPHHPAAPNDFRSTLAVGAVLFGRADCAALAGDGAGVLPWITGLEGMAKFDAIAPTPPRDSARLFPAGGYAVSRSSWAKDADYLIVDGGGRGSSTGGHAHADALAFELVRSGKTVLVDRGTYSYTPPQRDAFRATAAHNAITVDERSSSEPASAFSWAFEATGAIERWHAGAGFAAMRGSHDGFRRLADPAWYERDILAVHGSVYVVRDRLSSSGSHEMVAHFRGAAGLAFRRHDDGRGATLGEPAHGSRPLMDLHVFGRDLRVECADTTISPAYGVERAASACTVASRAAGDHEIVTILLDAANARPAQVSELTAERGRLFSIVRDDVEQLVGLSDGGGIVGGGVRSDAAFLWFSRDHGSSLLEECLVLDGGRLEVDGCELAVTPGVRSPAVPRETAAVSRTVVGANESVNRAGRA